MKTDWIKEKGLRGAMFWEASGDHKDQDRSLIAKVAREVSCFVESRGKAFNTERLILSRFQQTFLSFSWVLLTRL